MKQHITKNQYNQLSSEGKEKWRTFAILHQYDMLKETKGWDVDIEIPLPTIGQIIEFLSEKGWKMMNLQEIEGREDKWFVEVTNAHNGDFLDDKNVIGNAGEKHHKELIDAFWHAVREVLKLEDK